MSRSFRFTESLVNLLWDVSRAVGHNSGHYCDLETKENDMTFAAGDGCLMSLARVRGLLTMPGPGEYDAIIDLLTTTLKTSFGNPGYHLQICAIYDLDGDGAGESMTPLFDTARRIGISEDGLSVLKDWKETLNKYVAHEDVLLALWTTPEVLARMVAKAAKLKRKKRSRSATPWHASEGMMMDTGMKDIAHNHNALMGAIVSALKSSNVMVDELPVPKASIDIRKSLYPTSMEWRPIFGVKRYPSGASESRFLNETNIGAWAAPSLAEQFVGGGAHYEGMSMVSTGGRLYAPVEITVAPQDPEPYNNLFRRLMNKHIPYVFSVRIDSGGKYWWASVKHGATAILRLTSPESNKINKALGGIGDYVKSGGASVGLQMTAATWVDETPNDDDYHELHRRHRELMETIQGWGSASVNESYGDPLFTLFSSMPGWTRQCPAPIALAPLPEVLKMVPLFRPGMPWKRGSLLLRTADGKAMPYAQGSTMQTAWVDIGISPMGYGKSVTLSTINLAFVLAAGLNDLGFLSTTDIGPSSKGVIDLLRAFLPKDRQHWAIYHRLRMIPEHSVNVFDTPLGCRLPLPNHRFFLINMLSLLATPVGETRPYDSVTGIASACIDAAYNAAKDGSGARIYVRNICPEVDKMVDELNMLLDDHTTWWEVVDRLFDGGYIHEAGMAQRYAVPTLGDVAGYARQDSVTGTYAQKINDQLVTEIFWQSMMDAIRAYPIMKEPTRLDLSDARVIALDIDEVAPRGTANADRQTAVMFMLARHITASRFFEMPEDVKLMPEKYRQFHHKRLERIRELPKRLSWDEFHRASRNEAVATQVVGDVEVSIRESRKWNLHIGLYSQNINDYPEVLLDLASCIYILGTGTEKDVQQIVERLGLADGAARAIRTLRKPGKDGASFLAYYKTSEGTVIQRLMNTLGPMLLWVFSTTREDADVRDKLTRIVGYLNGIALLATNYSGGVKKRVEVLNELAEERGVDNDFSPINDIVDEMAARLTQ